MAQRTIKLGSLAPGINNQLAPTKLDTVLPDRSKGTFLYGADNVDIDTKGVIKRRRGVTLRVAGDLHSLWDDNGTGYGVLNGSLVQFDKNWDAIVIRANISKLPVSYSRGADGDIYWSNGQVIRRIGVGYTDRPVATDPLAAQPTVTLTAGALRAGRYLVTCTVLGPDGESPAATVQQIDVPEGSGLLLAASQSVQWYVSAPNGDFPFLQGAGATLALPVVNDGGRRCETLNTAVMPPGTIVRHYRGRMLVASGNWLMASNPYNYGIFDPSSGYFPFSAPITVLEPMDNGLWIVADQTYWIGDLFSDTPQAMLPFGGVPNSSARSTEDKAVYWQSDYGLVSAGNNGEAKAIQSDNLVFGPASSAATLYRRRDGNQALVSTRFGVEPSIAIASSFMEAEVIRKGTAL